MIRTLVIAIALVSLVSCGGGEPVTADQLVGTWQVNYGDAQERVVFGDRGELLQVYRDATGEKLHRGVWNLTPRCLELRSFIYFHPDLRGPDFSCLSVSRDSHGTLVIALGDPDAPYRLEKEPEPN
jgi:hypothetical protein